MTDKGDWYLVKGLMDLASDYPGAGEDRQKELLRRAAMIIGAQLLKEEREPKS